MKGKYAHRHERKNFRDAELGMEKYLRQQFAFAQIGVRHLQHARGQFQVDVVYKAGPTISATMLDETVHFNARVTNQIRLRTQIGMWDSRLKLFYPELWEKVSAERAIPFSKRTKTGGIKFDAASFAASAVRLWTAKLAAEVIKDGLTERFPEFTKEIYWSKWS